MLTPREVGPCEVLMQGIVGEGITLTPGGDRRAAPVGDQLPAREAPALPRASATRTAFREQHLFPQIQRICKRWLDEGYLVTQGRADRRRALSGNRRHASST